MDPLAVLMFARDNKVAEMEAALSLGVPPDVSNQMGQTALHIACLWGSFKVAEKLLDMGANVNIQNSRGQTPLHFAASARQRAKEVCEMLIKRGASKDIKDAGGRPPYEMADDDDIRTLLGGPDGRLFEYAATGALSELQGLLKNGSVPSVRVLDSKGRTALNIAISEKQLEIAKALLAHDPGCLDVPDSAGDTAVHCAIDLGDPKVLQYLLDLKPHINYQNLNPSEYAAGNWLLHGEAIMPVDKTPLHLAVEAGEVECAKLLLSAGADVNILDFDKRSALHLALEQQEQELVELLVQSGANVNQTSQDFVSPLHFVAQRGPGAVMKLLLDKGADVKLVNDDGWSALHLAARAGNAEKVQMLVVAGSAVSAPNSQGNTPLHLASVNGHAAVCKVLLENGADKSFTNKAGKTALDLAKNEETKAVLSS